ncbi:cytochrome c550 [Mesobacillus harenae]|uniref:cytochrome c550 n=1 Tax=Mesobacillus harenae TaxID=2213203 RepID=UPI00158038AD|nr:cytochrome c [Mesobacillus harenae]
MNRNPIIPFVLIMVFGIGLMFLLSFKGLGDAKEIAEQEEGGTEATEEVASDNPEEIYQQTCASCHGNQYEGGFGPKLDDVGSRLSQEELKEILVNGQGTGMPGGLVPGKEDLMAEWLAGLK